MKQANEIKTAKRIELPLIPLRGKVAFPNVTIVFEAGRARTLKAIEKASSHPERLLFILSQKDINQEEIGKDDLYQVGVVCRLQQITKLPGGNVRVHAQGLYRAALEEFLVYDDCFNALTVQLLPRYGDEVLTEAYFRTA